MSSPAARGRGGAQRVRDARQQSARGGGGRARAPARAAALRARLRRLPHAGGRAACESSAL